MIIHCMKSYCLNNIRLVIKINPMWGIDFNIFRSIFTLWESRLIPHLLCCQGPEVPKYSFAFDASYLRHPRVLQH
jgi:hypothetical protein